MTDVVIFSSQRNKTIDIIRGIAIISIIAGHLGVSQITRIVFTFHVPIFFIITGYFIKQEPFLPFIKKKANSLLFPYVLTCAAIVFIATSISLFNNDNIIDTAKMWIWASIYGAGDSYTEPFTIKAIGAIWFLWASFWGCLFMQKCLSLRSITRLVLVCGLFIFGYITAQKLFWFPCSIQAGCCSVLFMYVGYCVRSCHQTLSKLPFEIKLFTSFIAFVIWFSFIKNFSSFWMVHCDFGRGVTDIISSFCACFCIYLLSKHIISNLPFISSTLAFLGKNSLIILCIHIIELDIIKWWKLIEYLKSHGINSAICYLIILAIKLILIIGITYLIVKIKNIQFRNMRA